MIERYTTSKMKNIWTDDAKFKKMLEVELANLDALNKLGVVSLDDLNKIKEKAFIDVELIKQIEERTKHDVISFTEAVTSKMGPEKRWFHYGLTSTDVVDSSLALTLKEVNIIIEKDMLSLIDVLKRKALKYKDTLIIGRTHGMHAEVTSFGLKWLLWLDEAKRCFKRFSFERKNVEVIKLSGAVGNYNDISPLVEKEVAKSFNISSCDIATQVISRDRLAGYLFSLSMIASLLEKIALEVRHLSRTEIGEVEEAFAKRQKGSSAMPHKKNPITSENICGLSRVVRSNVAPSFENNTLWHERDISHSSVERIILPDTTILIDYMLSRYTTLLENLVVNESKMKENIDKTKGLIHSSKALLILCKKGLSREESYEIVQSASFDSDKGFYSSLSDKTKNYLTKSEIDDIFKVELKKENIDLIYNKVMKEE